jgi:hypothetical protein
LPSRRHPARRPPIKSATENQVKGYEEGGVFGWIGMAAEESNLKRDEVATDEARNCEEGGF